MSQYTFLAKLKQRKWISVETYRRNNIKIDILELQQDKLYIKCYFTFHINGCINKVQKFGKDNLILFNKQRVYIVNLRNKKIL